MYLSSFFPGKTKKPYVEKFWPKNGWTSEGADESLDSII